MCSLPHPGSNDKNEKKTFLGLGLKGARRGKPRKFRAPAVIDPGTQLVEDRKEGKAKA